MDPVAILLGLVAIVVAFSMNRHTESKKPATKAELGRLTTEFRSHSHNSGAESAIKDLRSNIATMRSNMSAMRSQIAAMDARLRAIEYQQSRTD